jgi:predicted Rossmann-fold nucleotide-binding protein
MPGGFGTLDEVFETITLMQTDKIKDFPVILVGSEYWGPIMDFLQKTVLTEATIGQADLNLVRVTDSVDEAVALITASECVKNKPAS